MGRSTTHYGIADFDYIFLPNFSFPICTFDMCPSPVATGYPFCWLLNQGRKDNKEAENLFILFCHPLTSILSKAKNYIVTLLSYVPLIPGGMNLRFTHWGSFIKTGVHKIWCCSGYHAQMHQDFALSSLSKINPCLREDPMLHYQKSI